MALFTFSQKNIQMRLRKVHNNGGINAQLENAFVYVYVCTFSHGTSHLNIHTCCLFAHMISHKDNRRCVPSLKTPVEGSHVNRLSLETDEEKVRGT